MDTDRIAGVPAGPGTELGEATVHPALERDVLREFQVKLRASRQDVKTRDYPVISLMVCICWMKVL